MKWSVTKSKIFNQCPKRWFFSERGWPSQKDKLRNEMYLLSQLKTINTWRGLIVDSTIDKFVIPKLRIKTIPEFDETMTFASDLMEEKKKSK